MMGYMLYQIMMVGYMDFHLGMLCISEMNTKGAVLNSPFCILWCLSLFEFIPAVSLLLPLVLLFFDPLRLRGMFSDSRNLFCRTNAMGGKPLSMHL